MDNKNEDKPLQLDSSLLSSDVLHKPKQSRIGKGMVAFLLGVLVGVVLMGAYILGFEELKHRDSHQDLQVQAPTAQSSEPGRDKITEEDLENYAVAKDCSTLSEYNDYTLSLSQLKMKTIRLEENLITAGREGRTNYIRWKNLPEVVDDQCNAIKLSDIEAGNLLNIYTQKSLEDNSNADYASDTRIIQKVSK